jgi:2-(1,2-epoxy-1,2-dihydrophenyl)acetyl-CoA isomerase
VTSSSDRDLVKAERHEQVLVLTLNAPQRRNALSLDMLTGLQAQLRNLSRAQTAGVVLTGAGDCFSAGADFRDITGTPGDEAYDDEVAAVAQLIAAAPVPVIGVVQGACLGAACDLLLSCDVVVAEPSAFLQVPAVKLGLLYNPCAIARMYTRLPDSTIRRLLLLGERFDAIAAREAGLVSTIRPSDDGLAWAVSTITGSWQPNSNNALGATKALINELAVDCADMDQWQRTRRELLGSESRYSQVQRAKARHHV